MSPSDKAVLHKPAALIFDMDGLMVDTERLYIRANEVIAAGYGKTVTMATIAKMMGRATLESLRIFAEELGISADPATLVAQRQKIMLDLIAADLVPMPGLREILAFAKPRLKLGLATGSPSVLVDEVLRRLELQHYFGVTQSSDGIWQAASGGLSADVRPARCAARPMRSARRLGQWRALRHRSRVLRHRRTQ